MTTAANDPRILCALSEVDTRLLSLNQRKAALVREREQLLAELRTRSGQLKTQSEAGTQSKKRQLADEQKLKEEQARIVERRKQLSALGAKAAKIMEREIDISSRAVETLESELLAAMEAVEVQEQKHGVLQAEVAKIEERLNAGSGEYAETLKSLEADIADQTDNRSKLLSQLDERARLLYQRVANRYPGSAVALAEGGSCKGCFRALPAQLYNQLGIPGALFQCPGCSRVLVRSDLIAPEAPAN